MISSEIQAGESLTVSARDFQILQQISNNSSRLSDRLVAAAGSSRIVLRYMVDLMRSLPDDGYKSVEIIAADAPPADPDAIVEGVVVDGGLLRVVMPLEVARAWFPIAAETNSWLGDPEAHYVTGYSTTVLWEVAQAINPEHWRRVVPGRQT